MQAATQYDEPLSDDLNLGALDRLTHSYLSSRFMEERLALPRYGNALTGTRFHATSLAYYRDCLEKMTREIEDVILSVRDLRSGYQAQHDKLLRSPLGMVEASTGKTVASVIGRTENFERSTSGIWNGMTAEAFCGMPERFRSYQGTISAIICAMAVKMCRCMDRFPTPGLGNPSRRIGLSMSKTRQGMEHIQRILGSAPAVAVSAAS